VLADLPSFLYEVACFRAERMVKRLLLRLRLGSIGNPFRALHAHVCACAQLADRNEAAGTRQAKPPHGAFKRPAGDSDRIDRRPGRDESSLPCDRKDLRDTQKSERHALLPAVSTGFTADSSL
jgi:hypothetical protein